MELPNFDDFLLHLKVNNYSAETIYNYELDLKVFQLFLNEEAKLSDFNDISKKTIELFKAYMASSDRKTAGGEKAEGNLASSSLNRCLSSLRGYLKYLIEMDLRCPIAPEVVKMIKTEKKHSRVAEFEELIKLIESPAYLENNPLVALRNQTILEVFFSTGMRISELCRLNKSDIDGTGRVFVIGKGKKERFVYLTPRAQKILERYLATRSDGLQALFVPYAGINVGSAKKRLSVNYIQMKIKEYRQKLKINVPTSAHSLRHGFATYLAESGASPAAIQILLGHESLDTTTRYVHASDKFAEETHRKFHPLAKVKET